MTSARRLPRCVCLGHWTRHQHPDRIRAMTGRDHYADIYSSQLDAEAKWLAFGAVHKADSVELLMAGKERSRTVLELGAGTGALTAELQRRAFADKYIAVEYSPDACAHMRKHLGGVEVRELDIVKDPISERANVVILSHVLEHLEEPDLMLSNVAKIDFDWLIIECPLEDLPASRIKNLFRDRMSNLAGHVQFFTAGSFRSLVSGHLEIVGERRYAPWTSAEGSPLSGRRITCPPSFVWLNISP